MIHLHKTGYLYQYSGGLTETEEALLPVESWHRTFAGAQAAKTANSERGEIHRILSDDHSERIS